MPHNLSYSAPVASRLADRRMHASSAPLTGVAQVERDVAKWMGLAEQIGHQVDLNASALANGALQRRRGVPSASALLSLALLYGPGHLSLRLVAERAERVGLAHLSEPALLRRLMNAAGWLEDVAQHLIIERLLGLVTHDGDQGSADFGDFGVPLALQHYDAWQSQAEAARHFLIDFMPWPDGMFNAAQETWLLCARWNYVASTMQDGPFTRDSAHGGVHTLERVRLMAHLIAALMPEMAI